MVEADEALISKSQQGDSEAFGELVRRTARLVHSQIVLAVGDAHRAEDLVQETFLLAHRKIRQLSDPHGFRPWLLTLSRSVTIDAVRHDQRKKRSAGRPAAAEMDLLADRRDAPVQALERKEMRARALDALRALPEEYRMPLALRYLAGADYEQIGRQLGLTNGSLRGLLHRGLALLRERLQEAEHKREVSHGSRK